MKGTLLSACLLLPLSVIAQTPATGRDMRELLPPNTALEQFVVTRDSMRTYYARYDGGIWLYDRRASAPSKIAEAPAWDLTLSAAGDAIAYSKAGDTRRDQQVWLVPLSRETGLPAGAERQLSATGRVADALRLAQITNAGTSQVWFAHASPRPRLSRRT